MDQPGVYILDYITWQSKHAQHLEPKVRVWHLYRQFYINCLLNPKCNSAWTNQIFWKAEQGNLFHRCPKCCLLTSCLIWPSYQTRATIKKASNVTYFPLKHNIVFFIFSHAIAVLCVMGAHLSYVYSWEINHHFKYLVEYTHDSYMCSQALKEHNAIWTQRVRLPF